MINIEKQIQYWIEGSDNDFDTAEILLTRGKVVHGLFFCHLAIEKLLKALIVNKTTNIPPKSHNLNYLQEVAEVDLEENQTIFLAVLMKYQLEGRYPEYEPRIPAQSEVADYYLQTRKLIECLKKKLLK
jgi:HEPN domain-containing protein